MPTVGHRRHVPGLGPNAVTVAVPGVFNGWNTTSNYLVEEGTSGIWSATSPPPGPGMIQVPHQWDHLEAGSARTPGGALGRQLGRLRSRCFNWTGDTRLAVGASDLVIYELHVGAFYDSTPASGGPGKFRTPSRSWTTWPSLGVNAVELMPLAEFAGDYSWGYNPADPYAVETSVTAGRTG